jgi:hypothetical protein
MSNHQIAEINVARMKGVNIQDPIMREFVDNLDKVNEIAENSEGFVWRLKDENNNATGFNPYEDEQVIINVSVWENIEKLERFTYQTLHVEFLKRRKEWFQTFGKFYSAIWWIPTGKFPTILEAIEKLAHLQTHGPSSLVFDFRNKHLSRM